MNPAHPLLQPIRELHQKLWSLVVNACEQAPSDQLASVADDQVGDTIFMIDKVGEDLLVHELARTAADCGGIVLVAEGVSGGKVVLPEVSCRYRVIADPIDGTRGLMYPRDRRAALRARGWP